jgi:hypothetical protein
MSMVQRLGSPLISTATLKMTALLAAGVTAILAGPTLYAQFVTPKIAAISSDDDRGIWKLPPPPRYLLESAGTTADDKTATVPRPAATASASAPKAETVLMKPPAPAPSSGLPTPPPAPPPAVAALGVSDAPGSLPALPTAEPARPILPAQPALRLPAATEAAPKRTAAPSPVPPSRLRTATVSPTEEPSRPSPAKAVGARPGAPRAASHAPTPPHSSVSKSAAPHAPAKAKPRPASKVAQARPSAPTQLGGATAPQPAAQPPQSQRIPVLSNILDGINSAGQAITNAVPKF